MSKFILTLVLAALVPVVAPAQPVLSADSAASGAVAPQAQDLSACAARRDGTTVVTSNSKHGMYPVMDLKPIAVKQVPVPGHAARLKIVGGLWPTPNIAAQAGSYDAVQAAIAPLPGGAAHGTGPNQRLLVQTVRLRAAEGRCP